LNITSANGNANAATTATKISNPMRSWFPREWECAKDEHDGEPTNRVVVCEEIASFGMPVGAEILETVRWEGSDHPGCIDW
jgi:hypothetical protein